MDLTTLDLELKSSELVYRLQPSQYIQSTVASVALTATPSLFGSPIIPWFTVKADLTAFTGTGDVIIGFIKDANNYAGILYEKASGKINYVVCVAGVQELSGLTPTGYTLPREIRFVCTGTLITGLVNGTVLGTWKTTTADFRNTSYFDGTWKYGAFTTNGTATLSNFVAGHFGCTAIGDNSIVTEENGAPITDGNKFYWAGSLRGFYRPGENIQDLLANNACGVFTYDTVTNEIEIVKIIFVQGVSKLYGEGSPKYVREVAAGGWHNFSPTWHRFPDGGGVCKIAKTFTTQNLLTPGITIFPIATELNLDPADTGRFTYDAEVVKRGGLWRFCYTVQALDDGITTDYMKFATSPDLVTFTHVRYDNTEDQLMEGMRGVLTHDGEYYFLGGGYQNIKIWDENGNDVGFLAQPAQVAHPGAYRGATSNKFPSHPAKLYFNGRYRYLGFDNTMNNGFYSYGRTSAYESQSFTILGNMAANVPAVVVSMLNQTFAEAGVTALNTNVIFEVGSPNKSYIPGRTINAISGFTAGKGYYIIPKANFNLLNVIPPLP